MSEHEPRSPDERLKLWAETLSYLAEPERSGRLIDALNEGDRAQVEALLEPTRIFQFGGCIDIHQVLTAVINFGPGHWEDECEVIVRIRPHNPSQTIGKGYRLPNGQTIWLTEAEWWEYYDRALKDPALVRAKRPLSQSPRHRRLHTKVGAGQHADRNRQVAHGSPQNADARGVSRIWADIAGLRRPPRAEVPNVARKVLAVENLGVAGEQREVASCRSRDREAIAEGDRNDGLDPGGLDHSRLSR